MIGVLTGCFGRTGDRGARFALLAVAAVACVVLPAAASAQTASPSDRQYSGNLEQVTPSAGGSDGGAGIGTPVIGGGGGGPDGAGSGLPFTGLDLGVLAAVAVALLGAGALLRRRRADEAAE